MTILYLLAGNGGAADWWHDSLGYFRHYQPQPLELPGFGDNPAPVCESLSAYADALLAATKPGHAILAVGVNALLVLHALQRRPGHFSRTMLLAPVGAFLWQRRLPLLMRWRMLRKLAQWLLANRPHWFARYFSKHQWHAEHYARMGAGYRRCRAFQAYWEMVQPATALNLLEWITDPVELLWGSDDNVLHATHAAAWSAILARAELSIQYIPGWGHYPWIDTPQAFAEHIESYAKGFIAHSKAGRLRVAELAGLPVPPCITLNQSTDDAQLNRFIQRYPADLWAVRASCALEDQADAANAGLSTSFIQQPSTAVPVLLKHLFAQGVAEVIVQRYIAPQVSGVAFVRQLAFEIEWIEGHLQSLVAGQTTPQRAIYSKLGNSWSMGEFSTLHGLTRKRLLDFLQRVLHSFHYVPGDIEWAWDGDQLWLLQYRPISHHQWRRHLTAANIGEILPAQPSRLVEYAQRRTAQSIPSILSLWDARVLEYNEPFTAVYADASYINNDLFLAQLADWGIPSKLYTQEVGGQTPKLAWNARRVIRALPHLLRMRLHSRAQLTDIAPQLQRFEQELNALIASAVDGQTLADWFVRFYLFVVQGNLCISTALASSGGSYLGQPATIYQQLQTPVHRVAWETDPASTRPAGTAPALLPFPHWPVWVRLAHRVGLPGMRGYYLQTREWYRDNVMRLYFRLHHAFPVPQREHWFAPHPAPRQQRPGFWQDDYADSASAEGFVIYPGQVEGVLRTKASLDTAGNSGTDILLVDALDPGLYSEYTRYRAVIARMGGRLSHGATLLRELRIPSAVIPSIDPLLIGRRVILQAGQLKAICAS